ncbi:AbrB/MazE/SpoVT family DNA-binding domain-containing protein [Inquilinus sp.]|jgi:AbrB family looped-hinge helix DNA binding protein|uniref:AbrB/MazE/SpoVT family DNA-binding domain-containing protein n=1 Tax=Inquilinus sp. TaxID=1932117 RepID=UPI003782DB42
MTVVRAKVSESGRLSIPAELRRAIGLEHGGDVIVDLDGREIRIRTVAEAVAQAQALSRRLLGDRVAEASVDNFLAERRREAERE